jgi:uncharacterized protein YuzB (UPF0349 family)
VKLETDPSVVLLLWGVFLCSLCCFSRVFLLVHGLCVWGNHYSGPS